VLFNSHLVVESAIVSSNQFVDPILTREDGCVLGDFIKTQGIQNNTIPCSEQHNKSSHSSNLDNAPLEVISISGIHVYAYKDAGNLINNNHNQIVRQVPGPTEMKISQIQSHCSHVVMLCHNGDGSGQKKIYSMFWRLGKKSISKKRGTFLLSRTLATAETCDRIPHAELHRTHSKGKGKR